MYIKNHCSSPWAPVWTNQYRMNRENVFCTSVVYRRLCICGNDRPLGNINWTVGNMLYTARLAGSTQLHVPLAVRLKSKTEPLAVPFVCNQHFPFLTVSHVSLDFFWKIVGYAFRFRGTFTIMNRVLGLVFQKNHGMRTWRCPSFYSCFSSFVVSGLLGAHM